MPQLVLIPFPYRELVLVLRPLRQIKFLLVHLKLSIHFQVLMAIIPKLHWFWEATAVSMGQLSAGGPAVLAPSFA